MERVDAVVVGAGAVGLAIARAVALGGDEVLLVERDRAIGGGVSSRSSEVIHAGLYYPAGSLKAITCLRGRDLLYAYAAARHIAHRRCGKLVVAVDEHSASDLGRIAAGALINGATGLRLLAAGEARALEPAARAAAALLSPDTGIIDSHAYMLALHGDAEAAGAITALATEVTRVTRARGGWRVHIAGEAEPVVETRWLINATGLGAQALASRIEDLPPPPPPRFAKGNYFRYAGPVPFQRLIYPLPEPGGLGVHLTLDLAGRARFGPDVEWVDTLDYSVTDAGRERFAAGIARWWPGLDPARLVPDYAGIRPKLSGPGEPAADFRVDGPAAHGLPGLVNLYGIESPGLTASLALAELVSNMVAGRLDRARAA